MKSYWIKAVGLLAIVFVLGTQMILARPSLEQARAAAVLASSYRLYTNSNAAIVSHRTVQAVLDASADGAQSVVYVKILTGQELFAFISDAIADAGERYPYFSGLRAETEGMLSGDGSTSVERLKMLYIGEQPIDFEAKYTVALSGDYAAAYEAVETEAAYQPDNSLLGSYLLSFGEAADESESAVTQEPDSASAPNQNDGIAILHNQTTILSSALVLVAIALAIYLIIWRKKKKDDKNDTSL